VASGDDWTLAALSPRGAPLVLVVNNDTDREKPYAFDLTRFARAGRTAQAWRTRDGVAGVNHDCRPTGFLPLRDSRFGDQVPARSVTTYVVDGMRAMR